MHYDFHPVDAPDPNDPDVQFGVAPEQITTELLELCEQFFRQASPAVHTELRQFLTEHGHYGDLGWFLDALGFTTSIATDLGESPGRRVTVSGGSRHRTGSPPVAHAVELGPV
jgi:hypothetical protein